MGLDRCVVCNAEIPRTHERMMAAICMTCEGEANTLRTENKKLQDEQQRQAQDWMQVLDRLPHATEQDLRDLRVLAEDAFERLCPSAPSAISRPAPGGMVKGALLELACVRCGSHAVMLTEGLLVCATCALKRPENSKPSSADPRSRPAPACVQGKPCGCSEQSPGNCAACGIESKLSPATPAPTHTEDITACQEHAEANPVPGGKPAPQPDKVCPNCHGAGSFVHSIHDEETCKACDGTGKPTQPAKGEEVGQ